MTTSLNRNGKVNRRGRIYRWLRSAAKKILLFSKQTCKLFRQIVENFVADYFGGRNRRDTQIPDREIRYLFNILVVTLLVLWLGELLFS